MGRRRDRRAARDVDDADDASSTSRWTLAQEALRERFDEPLERATKLTRRTLDWFPIRVWRHFLQNNGLLLAAGVSYQALFATFAAVYVAFAGVGLWLGASQEAIEGLISLINRYLPGLIGSGGEGVVSYSQVVGIARNSSGVLGITGIIAVAALIWTAIGSITYARRAVRDIFAIPPDHRPYLLLKGGDFFAAAVFGIVLMAGGLLGSVGTWALDLLFSLAGWSTGSAWFSAMVRIVTLLVLVLLNTAVLGGLFRFLTGTQLRWHLLWRGAMVGGTATAVLQLGAGLLLTYSPSNPLLTTFAVFVGLLLWFRLAGVVLLVSASWVAVAADDEEVPLLRQTETERRWAEHQALLVAAHVRLRSAREARDAASWFRRRSAQREVRRAEDELTRLRESAPPAPRRGLLLD